MRSELRQLVLILVLGLPLAVAVAGLGGYTLARRALRAGRAHERTRALDHRRTAERSAAGRQPGRRDGAAGDGVQRDARTAGAIVRADAAVHRGRVARAADAADRDPQRRRSRPARAPRRAGVSRHHRQHARGSGSAGEPGRSPADAVARGDGAGAGCRRRSSICAGWPTKSRRTSACWRKKRTSRFASKRAGAPHAYADRFVVRQALINLVDNAIKFSPAGGRIAIRVGETADAATLDVDRQRRGIDAGERDRIFDRFYRAAHAAGEAGAGLGLSIAKGAVEANGGRLAAGSVGTDGSTFRIALPRAKVRLKPDTTYARPA